MKSKTATILLAAALTLATSQTVWSATTYTCPSTIRAQDTDARASVTINLVAQTMNVYYNLFTTAPSGWSATASSGFLASCRVSGQVVNQTSRVLLVCNCVGKVNNAEIQGSATYSVAGGSQCTYQGNLQFQCN